MDQSNRSAAAARAPLSEAPGAPPPDLSHDWQLTDSLPTIRLDTSGTIIAMSAPALAMLNHNRHDYDTCFFTHLDRRSVLPVMRDVASMVCRGKRTARWLMRMRTGRCGWRWVRAQAVRVITQHSCEIRITLANIGD